MDKGQSKSIALTLSGGGSRAIAFHLGCFRALEKLKLLDHVKVISSVSGGSVINAMYSYENVPFDHFEKRVTELLRHGLQRDGTCHWLMTGRIVINLLNLILVFLAHGLASLLQLFSKNNRISPRLRLRRRCSRTDSLIYVLESKWLGRKFLHQIEKPNLEAVINACELQTTTAFRFGNTKVLCWPFGVVREQIRLAEAVVASAAYPVFLPALDRTFAFEKDGIVKAKRVVLTDGGVYENLGMTPVVPGRDPRFAFKTTDCDVIVACDAGVGHPDELGLHQWILPRLIRSFDAVMRRVQSGNFQTLFDLRERGLIKGFVLSYLGQDDAKLPPKPADFVTRREVEKYPTNFSKMTDKNIDLLSRRGEQLTELLIREYLLPLEKTS